MLRREINAQMHATYTPLYYRADGNSGHSLSASLRLKNFLFIHAYIKSAYTRLERSAAY